MEAIGWVEMRCEENREKCRLRTNEITKEKIEKKVGTERRGEGREREEKRRGRRRRRRELG